MKKKRILISVICILIFTMWHIGAGAATTKSAPTIYSLQSDHSYSGNCDITWEYTHALPADKLEITFSADTQTEANCDYIYILDSNGSQIGKYSGTQLAGKTVTVKGNAFKIRLTSNFSISYYGFRVTDIVAYSSQSVTTLSQGTCGSGTSWTLTSDGTLTISGQGSIKNYSSSQTAPWYSLKNQVHKLVIEDEITSVGSYAFYYCTNLKEAILGEGVKSISTYAFYNASDLSKITLPKSLESVSAYAFESCKSLKDVYYYSSESDFSNITVGANNSPLTKATKHYILSGQCGENLTWTLGFDGILYVTGQGDMENYTYSVSAPWYSKKSEINGVNISDTVTSIGDYAFYYLTNITEITLPNGITSIGANAFYQCSNLKIVTIPDSVETIGKSAFSYCSYLNSIHLGKNVKDLGEQVFYYASRLSNISVDEENPYFSSSDGVLFDKNKESLIWYPKGKTQSSYQIPNTVKTIGSYAFYYCTNLTSVTLPENLCEIGSHAFSICSKITGLEIPQTVTKIDSYAFSSCSKIEAVTIPPSLDEIENGVFSDCSSLLEIAIPQSVTKIGSSAFSSCSKLFRITMGDNVTSIGSYAFSGCKALTSVTIPQKVTEILSSAFEGCSLLERVSMSDNVETIDYYAFKNCSALSGIKLSTNLTIIDMEAFANCTSLSEIIIPDSVVTIGYGAFSGCSGMKSVKIGKGVTLIKEKAFYNCTSLEKVDVSDIAAYLSINFEKNTSSPSVYADELYENGLLVPSLHIPSTLTDVKAYAIDYSNIKSITVDKDNPTYSDSDGVLFDKEKTSLILYPPSKPDKSYTIPDTVTSLSSGSFSNCVHLESITIPQSVKRLNQVFTDCPALKSVTYLGDNSGSNLNGNSTFLGCPNLEVINCPNVTKISNFKDLTNLKSADFSSAKEIYEYTFYNCSALEYVNLPILEKVENYTFSNCSSLKTNLYIASPSSISIGKSAFYNCKAMTQITLASGYTYNIGSYAFDGCTNLKTIYISQGAGDISDGYKVDFGQFSKSTISSNAFSSVTATVYLPTGYYDVYDYGDFGGNLTWVSSNSGTCGKDAFWNYNTSTKLLYISGTGEITDHWFSGSDTPWTYHGSEIEKVIVSSGITHIDSYVFEYMESVKEIQLPNTLQSLAYNAFNDCQSLENLMLPASLEAFTNSTYSGFIRCPSLMNIYYLGTEQEFEKIIDSSYAKKDGRVVHFLVWNKSSATCTEAGVEGYYRFDDNSVYDMMYDSSKNVLTTLESVPATGHTIVLKEEIKATCSETGLKERYECTTCSEVFEDEKGTLVKTDYITELDPSNHQGGTEIRGNENGYTGDTYCLGCETVLSYGEDIYKIQISGDTEGVINQSGIKQIVRMGTDKDAALLYCHVKYPEYLTLTAFSPIDFSYVEKEDEYTQNGYTTSVFIAQYSDSDYIPKDVIHSVFEMSFDISKTAPVGAIEIEATDETILAGNEIYSIDNRVSSQITILPKLVETIEIEGDDTICQPTKYLATVFPDFATDKRVLWASDNTDIATIDEDGILTPVKGGTVTIRATANDGSGIFKTKVVEIIKYAESIQIFGDEEISVPTTYTATVLPDFTTNKNVVWSVDDESVATVDENGLVTPLRNGKIILTATAEDESGVFVEKSVVVTVNIRIDTLITDVGVWDKEFSSDITEYIITVPEGTQEIFFTSTFKDAALKINGTLAMSGMKKKVLIEQNETAVTLALSPRGDNLLRENTYFVTIIRGSFTKTEISEDKKEICVTPVNVESGKTIAVALMVGDRLVGMQHRIFENDKVCFTTDKEFTRLKIFVLESLESMKPVCKAEEIR